MNVPATLAFFTLFDAIAAKYGVEVERTNDTATDAETVVAAEATL